MHTKSGLLRRGMAFFLDFVFLSVFFFPITYIYSGRWVVGPEEHLWGISDPICLIFLFIILAYFIIMEAYVGWTIGKRILSVRVVDRKGNNIGFQKSVIRNLLRVVDGLPIFNLLGIILIVFWVDGQRFGDRIAKTYVIRQSKS